MKSTYETYCFACNGLIYKGDEIVFDEIFNKWVHPDCQVKVS
jgi:hypothetical protein